MKANKIFTALLATLTFFTLSASASASSVFANDQGIAINGYDTVAYFTEGEAVEGSSKYTHKWNEATWNFKSEENRALFAANPEKYAPQYGGYCAWGVSAKKSLFPVEPTAWKVVEGKLYLNNSLDIQKQWLAKEAEHITAADKNWPTIEK